MKEIKIVIKQEHIDKGIPVRPQYCAVALALDRDPYESWGVRPDCIRIGRNEYIPSLELRRFIRRFDSNLLVEPGTYTARLNTKQRIL